MVTRFTRLLRYTGLAFAACSASVILADVAPPPVEPEPLPAEAESTGVYLLAIAAMIISIGVVLFMQKLRKSDSDS